MGEKIDFESTKTNFRREKIENKRRNIALHKAKYRKLRTK